MDGLSQGEIIAGKYRVEKTLGTGGMGYVVAAHHIQLDQKVAIKCLLPEILGNPEAVTRFTREARAAVKITSEHVAHVFDVGTLESGAPYIVMEYLDGGDLGAWIEHKGVLSLEQAVEFVLQACEAIAEAHSLGIVHRDLKPANIFCIRRADGVLSAKVLDFGISKVVGPIQSGAMDMTKTTSVLGSPYYMSPEQLRASRDVDARTDIWSLGVILFQLLTGNLPFSSDALPDLFVKIVHDPTPSVREYRPDMPAEIDAIIGKCLHKNREQRYANIAELAVALVRFGPKRARSSVDRVLGVMSTAGLSASALALPPSSDACEVPPASQTEAAWGRTAVPAKGRTKWLAIGLSVVVAALGLAAFTWMKLGAHGRSHPEASAAAAATDPPPTSAAPNSAQAVQSPEAAPNSSAATPASAEALAAATTPTPELQAKKLAPPLSVPSAAKTEKRSKVAAASTAAAAGAHSAKSKSEAGASKANCSPPYTLDSEGFKHFKPECFKK
jgi:eukaryotic-like serine/threonine-protein kinase